MDDYVALVMTAEAEARRDQPVVDFREVTCESGVYGWFRVETNRLT